MVDFCVKNSDWVFSIMASVTGVCFVVIGISITIYNRDKSDILHYMQEYEKN